MITLILFVIFILLWIYYNYSSIFEHFQNISSSRYKPIMITPQPMIYDKLTLYTNNLNKITYQIGNNIQEFYPLDKIIPINSSFEIIKRLENSTNSIGIIEDEAYRQYNNDNPNIVIISYY